MYQMILYQQGLAKSLPLPVRHGFGYFLSCSLTSSLCLTGLRPASAPMSSSYSTDRRSYAAGTGASAYAASRRHSPRTAWRISMMEKATLWARTLNVASGTGICFAADASSLLASSVSGPHSRERSTSLAL